MNKEPGQILVSDWLLAAMRGLPVDQPKAQVQGFNEDGRVRERGINSEFLVPV